jgi:hypothetical protein
MFFYQLTLEIVDFINWFESVAMMIGAPQCTLMTDAAFTGGAVY